MRQRILWGIFPIFLLIAGTGIYAMALFLKLGSSVDVVLQENFQSVVAGQKMKEAAENISTGLLFSLLGEVEKGRHIYDRNLASFQGGIQAAENNVTVPGERKTVEELTGLNDRLVQEGKDFWVESEPNVRRAKYFEQMRILLSKIKANAQGVMNMNQDAMFQADLKSRELSSRSVCYMLLVSALGIAAAAFFAIRLQRAILQPIQTLAHASQELGKGKLDQIVPVQSKDELGQLAATFNKMASRLRAYQQVSNHQILQARQMTETSLSAFPDPIIMLSPNREVRFINPAAAELSLTSIESLPETVRQQSEVVLNRGTNYLPTGFEKAIAIKKSDKEIFFLPRIIGLREENGELLGAVVILQDVTRLRLLDEMKNNLVSTTSHELKTPLNSIRMGLHLLLEERIGDLNPQQTELMLTAREDAERLLTMIDHLLDLTKLESNKMFFHFEKLSTQSLIQTIWKDFHMFVESKGSKLVTRIGSQLPNVCVDLKQISHVFSNFISNAVKHTRRGEEIVLATATQNGKVRFSVINPGEEIPPQYQSLLFDRFFRVPNTEPSGAGLGLAIAKEIVVAHGGSIGVHSQSDIGTEFYFDLLAVS